ncbi:MAG: Holliday junction resolvase RuvX [Chloroflexia bacterium]|nr:Holliday junction resolvase RuvX [Chloroflexia bacterium]
MKTSGRLLGLDLGQRRIGVALSDPGAMLATPLTTIHLPEAYAGQQEVRALVEQHEVVRVVVGLPLLLDGGEGEEAAHVRAWVERLCQQLSVPLELWDERLSTAGAERALLEGGLSRRRRRQHRDAVAAALILQSYLDAHMGSCF